MKASASSERSKTSHSAGPSVDKETTNGVTSPPSHKISGRKTSAPSAPVKAPAPASARASAPANDPGANDSGAARPARSPLPQEAKTRHVNSAEALKTVSAPVAAAPAPVAPVVAAPVTAGPVSGASNRPVMTPRPLGKEEHFVEGDYVVYPTHGVGKVEKIAAEQIAGHTLELIHITFEENRMTLRVPVAKARSAGLRKLATQGKFDEALAVLKGRARVKRTMWSRRAQEYEAKINSGDPIAIAEVVRDLHRNAGQPDQSFSERQIYESAMDRLAAELAALDSTDKDTAVAKLANFLKAA